MGTNTSGAALIADGTNFNPVVISGDATIATNGALTIANDAVESEHLNDNVISGTTELAAIPADTDELIISDAGTLKRVDYSLIKSGTPAFQVALTLGAGDSYVQSVTSNTLTLIEFDDVEFDTDSGWTGASTHKWTVPAGKDGLYLLHLAGNAISSSNDISSFILRLYLNGNQLTMKQYHNYADEDRHIPLMFSFLANLSAGDYIQGYAAIIGTSPAVRADSFETYISGARIG